VTSFVAQLAALCRAEPTRAKWVIVPSHALGHTLGERLVLEGTSWANLRFTTPLDLALPMAAPFLVERGIDPAGDSIGPALIMRLLMDLSSTVPAYFRHLADQPRMAEALWATLSELRLAGVTAAGLHANAFVSSAKHAELRALLESYEAHLQDRRLADRARVYHEALEHLDVSPVLSGDLRIELPGIAWAPLERRLLDGLAATRVVPKALALPELEVPRHVQTRGAPAAFVKPVPASDAERLAYLMEPTGPAQGDGTLQMFRAGGREAEVEEVFRRIAASGVALDRVEIACATADDAALVWEKAARHEWPVTVRPGVPVVFTRPGRALVAFCDWVAGGLAAGTLRRMLQSGDLRIDIEDGPSAGQAARLLARSEATWGRATYGAALTLLAETSRARAADSEETDAARLRYAERTAHAERLRRWIADLLALVPEDGPAPLAHWLEGATTFVRSFARKASELDGEAAVALVDALAELAVLGDVVRSPAQALALLRSRLDGLSVGADRARPGHLHVSMLSEAGYGGRPHTYVLGLGEGRVFPALVEDPVLLDAERERIDPALRTSGDRVSEAVYRVVSRLAELGGRVCLSFSCRDLRQARATFPSWLLLQAVRVLQPDTSWTYDRLAEELGEPVSAVPARPDQALGDAGWWLAGLRGADRTAAASIRDAFPALAAGEDAEAARESEAFTAYDGLVPEAGPKLDPRVSGTAVSPTSLEDLAKCPFRYFLQRGLGLDPIEEAEPDPDVWLDPRTRGSLLHDLYARVLRELRHRKEAPDPARHGPWLRGLGEQALARHRQLVPPPTSEVFARESRAFLTDLDLFLRFESEERGREWMGFEVSFGAGSAEGEPLARAEPITLDLGAGLRFKLRGRIDRIDRLPDGSYEAMDYKTGLAFLPGGLDATFAGGRQLQHALYALAAVELLRARDPAARVVGSYYFPTVRGGRERVVRAATSQARAGHVLRELFDLLGAGAFVHTATEDDCRFCDFERACGSRAAARAARKVDELANTALDPYRRLGTHA
jgi:ATP-dependent helicase/nuclease subunit B